MLKFLVSLQWSINHDGWLNGEQENKPKFNVEVEKTIETEKKNEDALELDDVDGNGENGNNSLGSQNLDGGEGLGKNLAWFVIYSIV